MATKIQNGFDPQDTSALHRMLGHHKTPDNFARNLIDELRGIAGCKANADTCQNKVCQLAHAIERGLDGLDAFGRATEPPLRTSERLRCPYCRYQGKSETQHGGTFRYLANETTWRNIIGLRDGILKVQSVLETYYEDEEHNERIECRNCLKEFLLTRTIEVEFV